MTSDAVFEAAGSPLALAAAIGAATAGSTVVVAAQHVQPLPLPSRNAFGKELTLRWSLGATRRDFHSVVELMAASTTTSLLEIQQVALEDVSDELFDRLDGNEQPKTIAVVSPDLLERDARAKAS